jgi:hypothetical protein
VKTLQKACSGFPIAAYDSKVVPKAALDTETCSKSRPWRMAYAGENCHNERQGEPEQKFYAAFGKIFRITKSFKQASRNFLFLPL